MNIQKMEELLLQEMEYVKGGVAGTISPVKGCLCESGAGQGTDGSGSCTCTRGGAGQIKELIVVPPTPPCVCPSGAQQ